jgi:hypothetical protein
MQEPHPVGDPLGVLVRDSAAYACDARVPVD